MGQALLFGLIGSSALVSGGTLGAYWRVPQRISGVLLAFASVTLISALAFELFPEAVELGGLWPAGLGLFAGGLTFVIVNTALDSWLARSAGDPHEVPGLPPEVAEDISGAEADQSEQIEGAAPPTVVARRWASRSWRRLRWTACRRTWRSGSPYSPAGEALCCWWLSFFRTSLKPWSGPRRDASRRALGAVRGRDLVASRHAAHRRG